MSESKRASASGFKTRVYWLIDLRVEALVLFVFWYISRSSNNRIRCISPERWERKYWLQGPEAVFVFPKWRKMSVFGLAYRGKDIVFRFIIEYSGLMDSGLCWNLRLVAELEYLEGFWFLLEEFLKIIFLHGEIFEFP